VVILLGAADTGRYAKKMKIRLTLYAIAGYLIQGGIGGYYQLVNSVTLNSNWENVFSHLVINTGLLVGGTGLFLQKGWGRNTSLMFNGYYLYFGVINRLLAILSG
jgi:hypothetical protein